MAEEADAQHLDPWIFQAIIYQETRWSPLEIRHEHDGSCSVGLGQINVPCRRSAVAPLLDPHKNIRRMGVLLAHFRSSCHDDCADLGWLRAYNPGSPAYFEAVREAVRRYHAQASQPDVHRVPSRVHAPRVQRQAAHRAGDERWLDDRDDHP